MARLRYALTIPARINILGNPADANEGDHATVSAAIELRAGAFVEPDDRLVIERLTRIGADGWTVKDAWEGDGPPPVYDGGPFDLIKGAINRLYQYSPEFRDRWASHRVKISTWTDVPRQSGLGGSSLLVLLTLAGLRAVFDLDPRRHNDYVLAELTQRVEAGELGITCGFADRYVPLFGGFAYLDYRGKLHHKPIGAEPFVTYERLDAYVPSLPLIIAYTGVIRDSGDVHAVMRGRYLEEYAGWTIRSAPPFMVQIMEEIGATAWKGKIAGLAGDWETFGALMNENHRLVDLMMTYCGFSEGAGWANNLLIEAALSHGALGAKLTGAGGGGSVFALVRPGDEARMIGVLEDVARHHGLTDAWIFQCEIARQGLTIRPAPP
jgi:galactokinase/mevalonate kinase-like predicted kinase